MDKENRQIRKWFEIWLQSKEGEKADVRQKEVFWTAFRAGFTRCLTDGKTLKLK